MRNLFCKAISTKEGSTRVVASTADIDRDGDILDQGSWQLDNFKANPVIIWGHDYSLPPIGRAEGIKVENGQLVADIVWDTEQERGATVARQFSQGFLNSVSVGFRAGSATPRSGLDDNDERKGAGGFILADLELLEISAVTVPANPRALAAKGLDTEDVEDGADLDKRIRTVVEDVLKELLAEAPEVQEDEQPDEGQQADTGEAEGEKGSVNGQHKSLASRFAG